MNGKILTMAMALLAAAGLGASGALRAEAFLCVGPGGSVIPGEATAERYSGCIEVIGFAERLTVEQLPPGSGVPAKDIGPVKIVKRIDQATPLLIHSAALGLLLPKTTLTFVREIGGELLPYYEIILEGTVLVVETSATGGEGVPTEQISLSFSRITWKYTLYNEMGVEQAIVEKNYDVVTGASF